jgi:hypothetical protein
MLDNYKLTDESPVKVGDIVSVGGIFYKILQLEPLYYKFQNLTAGINVGFNSQIYQVNDLVPSSVKIYYITGFGINGDIEAQVRYQTGSPRNTVDARTSQRVSQLQAHYLNPFTFHFCVVAGDTLDVDILAAFAGVKAEMWFYGWKYKISRVPTEPPKFIELEDVRQY